MTDFLEHADTYSADKIDELLAALPTGPGGGTVDTTARTAASAAKTAADTAQAAADAADAKASARATVAQVNAKYTKPGTGIPGTDLADSLTLTGTPTIPTGALIGADPITEFIQDKVAALIVAGANITTAYDDAAGTLTIAGQAGGSGGGAAALTPTATKYADYTAAAGDLVVVNAAWRTVIDAAFSSSTAVTSATGAFTANDVGKPLSGVVGIPANAKIASVTSATAIVATTAMTVSGGTNGMRIGGAVTVTLPSAPADKATVAVRNVGLSGVITLAGTQVGGGTMTFNGPGTMTVQWDATAAGWNVVSTDVPQKYLPGNGAQSRVGARTNAFSRDRLTYNFKTTNTLNLQRAIARARRGDLGLSSFAMAGDSKMVYGTSPSSSDVRKTWPGQLYTGAEARGLKIAGTGFVMCRNNTSSTINRDPRWAFTGTWSGTTGTSNAYNSNVSSATSGDTAVFTTDRPGVVVEVLYDGASGPFTITAGTNAAVTVTPSGTAGPVIRSVTLGTPLVAGDTVTLALTTSVSTIFHGINVRGSNGLQVSTLAHSSASSFDWQRTGALVTANLLSTGVVPADVVFYQIGGNDYKNNGISLSLSKTYITSFVNAQKAIANRDVVLVTTTPMQDCATKESAYIQMQYDLADSLDVPLIDLNAAWQPWGTSTTALFYDAQHENTEGYAFNAEVIRTALGL